MIPYLAIFWVPYSSSRGSGVKQFGCFKENTTFSNDFIKYFHVWETRIRNFITLLCVILTKEKTRTKKASIPVEGGEIAVSCLFLPQSAWVSGPLSHLTVKIVFVCVRERERERERAKERYTESPVKFRNRQFAVKVGSQNWQETAAH